MNGVELRNELGEFLTHVFFLDFRVKWWRGGLVPGNPQPAEVRRLWLFLLGEGKFTRDQRRKKIQKLFIYSTNFVIVERRINSLKSNDSSQENISQVVREDFILFSGGLGTPRHKDKKEKGDDDLVLSSEECMWGVQ